MDRSVIRERVEQTGNVSTMPNIVAKLRAMIDNPSASAQSIGDEIGRDQVLTAKVLRLVNSGFYGFRTPITTITQAMVLLGFDVIRTLVMSAAVLDILELMNKSLAGLWEHSVGTAAASNLLAQRLGLANPEEIAVSGLLHDLGKVIIAQRFPAEHTLIRTQVDERNCLQIQAEREVLGVTHAEVGLWLLRRWGLPSKLTAPIAFHNNFHPTREHADRTAVVHIANIISRARGLGFPGDRRIPAIDRRAWHLLDLEMSLIREVTVQLDAELADTPFA